jgi:hypothetical protein
MRTSLPVAKRLDKDKLRFTALRPPMGTGSAACYDYDAGTCGPC